SVYREIKLLVVETRIKSEVGFRLVRTRKNPVLLIDNSVLVRIGEDQVARTGTSYVRSSFDLLLALEYPNRIVQPEAADRLSFHRIGNDLAIVQASAFQLQVTCHVLHIVLVEGNVEARKVIESIRRGVSPVHGKLPTFIAHSCRSGENGIVGIP